MADNQQPESARRRTRVSEPTSRSGALERLKALRSAGRRSEVGGVQIKIDQPIYDVIPEEDYKTLVANRREEFRNFVVDGDGSGYVDEGQEEDWSKDDFLSSSDGSDDGKEPGKTKRKKVEKEARPKRPSSASKSLSAAADMMGKHRLSSMFTSSVFAKNKDERGKGIACDSIVDDVIAEFAPNEADRERRRRIPSGHPAIAKSIIPRNLANSSVESLGRATKPSSRVSAASESNVVVGNGSFMLNHNQDCDLVGENGDLKEELGPAVHDELVEEKSANLAEVKDEPVAEMKEEVFTLNAKVTKEEKDPAFSATAEWKAVRNDGDVGDSAVHANNGGSLESEETLDFDLDSDGSLPFYILDAHEEFYGANAGNIYLFGKVIEGTIDVKKNLCSLVMSVCHRNYMFS